MKTLKLSLMALVSIAGLTGAFANTVKHSKTAFNSFYYAVTDAHGSFKWTTVRPSTPLTCQTGSLYCTVDVVTGYTPINNQQVPAADIVAGTTPISGVYK